MTEFVLFDDVRANQAFVLTDFCEQETLLPHQLAELDNRLQRGWQRNWHCAIFADYEFGLPLQKLADLGSGSLKIVWFAQKTALSSVETWLHTNHAPAAISTPRMNVSEEEYCQAIDNIQQAIKRGDTYQINYTVRLHLQAYGSPRELYRQLRQNVPFAVLAKLPENEWTLCFSPELFLNIQADGILETKPMKGTAPILGDGLDNQRATELQNDPKNRAENTMIVDLLRNDLGKLAQIGGVSVPAPFEVTAFGSVWQMTSTVRAQLRPHTSVAQIFQAAFPCGSITGAPKRKSMEIIAQLETEPRGLYTGSIGFLSPAPNTVLGFSGCLNVVIRTLQLRPEHGAWRGVYGVGSGIVIDSRATDEYAECGWKAKFLTQLRPNFDIFETMRVENGQIAWLDKHLARLQQSCLALNVPFSLADAQREIQAAIADLHAPHRFKLTVQNSGSLKTEFSPIKPLLPNQKVMISELILPRENPLRCHKISHRADFDRVWQTAEQHGAFDALIFNEDGYLLEGGRSSVMIWHNNQWLTPELSLDILPSVARAVFMAENTVHESKISRKMLEQAEKILLGNALRGWFEVDLITE